MIQCSMFENYKIVNSMKIVNCKLKIKYIHLKFKIKNWKLISYA